MNSRVAHLDKPLPLVAFSDPVGPSPAIHALIRSAPWIWRTRSKKRSRSCDWTAYGLNRMKSELEAFSRKRHCRAPRPSLMRSTYFGESFASKDQASGVEVKLRGGRPSGASKRGRTRLILEERRRHDGLPRFLP
jgi:hypothetical protein